MKIIVTGGAGYIGSHTLKTLHENGHETLTIDNLSTGHKRFVKWGEFEEADVCDFDKLKSIYKNIFLINTTYLNEFLIKVHQSNVTNTFTNFFFFKFIIIPKFIIIINKFFIA